jgi:hypothetical protein
LLAILEGAQVRPAAKLPAPWDREKSAAAGFGAVCYLIIGKQGRYLRQDLSTGAWCGLIIRVGASARASALSA